MIFPLQRFQTHRLEQIHARVPQSQMLSILQIKNFRDLHFAC